MCKFSLDFFIVLCYNKYIKIKEDLYMTLKEVLIEFCEANELTYSDDYSGRGMFG